MSERQPLLSRVVTGEPASNRASSNTHLSVLNEGERLRSASIRTAAQRAHDQPDTCEEDHHDDNKGFGEKTITFAGSFCLNLNNCMGPAMVLLPLVYSQAGWFTPTLVLIIIFILSSFNATMLCEAMQRIPNNFNFEHRYVSSPPPPLPSAGGCRTQISLCGPMSPS